MSLLGQHIESKIPLSIILKPYGFTCIESNESHEYGMKTVGSRIVVIEEPYYPTDEYHCTIFWTYRGSRKHNSLQISDLNEANMLKIYNFCHLHRCPIPHPSRIKY